MKRSMYLQIGDGVKGFAEGDTVIPMKTLFGTWRSLAVCKAADLLKQCPFLCISRSSR